MEISGRTHLDGLCPICALSGRRSECACVPPIVLSLREVRMLRGSASFSAPHSAVAACRTSLLQT